MPATGYLSLTLSFERRGDKSVLPPSPFEGEGLGERSTRG
jgi:hypothetical protein